MTLSNKALSIRKFSIMTLRTIILSVTALSITFHSIMALGTQTFITMTPRNAQ
jgi:hypothetical protein